MLILTLVVTLALGGFFLLATSMFENDKIAYVYSKLLSDVQVMDDKLSDFKSNYEKMLGVVTSLGGTVQGHKLLDRKGLLKKYTIRKIGNYQEKVVDKISTNLASINLNSLMFTGLFTNDSTRYAYTVLADSFFKEAVSITGDEQKYFVGITEGVYPKDERIEKDVVKYLRKNIFSKGIISGVKEVSLGGANVIVSFSRVSKNVYFVTRLSKSKALSALYELRKKFFYYFLVILSLAVIISTIFTNQITSKLETLKEVMEKFGEGDMKQRAKISSNDEVGKISSVFDQMSSNIEKLVEEVRLYSTELEHKVKKRTASLAKAMRLQKAMMNSVDQGFVMINKNLKLMNVYSKVAADHFGEDLEGQRIVDLLGLDDSQKEVTEGLFGNFFKEVMPFRDLSALAPQMIKGNGERDLSLTYEPILSKSDKFLGFVVTSSDKTEELRLENEAELQRIKGKMLLKIINGKLQFTKLLQLTNEYLEKYKTMTEDSFCYEEAFLIVHTLKGGYSSFYISEITSLLHDYETKMKEGEDLENSVNMKVLESCFVDLSALLDSFLTEYGNVLGVDSWRDIKTKIFYEVDEIKKIVSDVRKCSNISDASQILNDDLLKVAASHFLSTLKDEAVDHSVRQGKPVEKLFVTGEDTRVYPDFFNSYVSVLIHLLRNSIDHGLEGFSERINLGKSAAGSIELEIFEKDGYLNVYFKDDGAGIDTDKIKAKADEKGMNTENLNEKEIQLLIFDAGFSTSSELTETSGRGVGMSAVKGFVLDYDGVFDIESETGVGTTFKMKFPLENICPQSE